MEMWTVDNLNHKVDVQNTVRNPENSDYFFDELDRGSRKCSSYIKSDKV